MQVIMDSTQKSYSIKGHKEKASVVKLKRKMTLTGCETHWQQQPEDQPAHHFRGHGSGQPVMAPGDSS